ncbi:hypothetical protein AB6A40_009547 [Gnathostoma spinigerum]|uniref:Homologous-pairing protein 2 winged helix domain-containing protein n=1 Tax=Gnathostoma spinigerum TaxID=75299 RepID=A0ABD6ESA9_9BILA
MSKAALEEKALQEIPAYIVAQNRPYSCIDVWTNLHQQYGKTLVTKCLDTGVERGILCEKTISKQKIYFPNQTLLPKQSEEELIETDKQIETKASLVNSLEDRLKALCAELKIVKSCETTESLQLKQRTLSFEIQTMGKKLAELEQRKVNIDPEKKKQMAIEYDLCMNHLKKRKRLAEHALGTILENCPIEKKKLIDEIGLEIN